jgi:DNA-binding transcriptional ArsR family regulator
MSLLELVNTQDVVVAPEELAPLFKALAHPRRLAILQSLRDGELCVCEIEQALGLRQAYVSQQLTVLREAGLVCYRKDGWNVYYRIARSEAYTLLEMATVIHGGLGACAVIGPEDSPEQSCTSCPQ